MLYLMAVLTFLAGILFYTLSPREDRLNIEVFQGEPFIQSFLSQHQAAKDYLRRWYGIQKPDPADDRTVFNLQPEFLEYMDIHLGSEMCYNNAALDPLAADDAPCFVSRIACLNTAGTAAQACKDSDNIYVVTYGGLYYDAAKNEYERPAWWPQESTSRARRNERWRRSFATRTSGSQTCGTIFDDPTSTGNFCLDNGVRAIKNGVCAKPIPAGLVAVLFPSGPTSDMFLCMSKVKQGPFAYYPANLVHFWDGLDNQAKHAPNSSSKSRLEGTTGKWLDLVSTTVAGKYDTSTKVFSDLNGAYFGPDSVKRPAITLEGPNTAVDFDINSGVLTHDFTLTLLVGFDPQTASSVGAVHDINPAVDLIRFESGTGGFLTLTARPIDTSNADEADLTKPTVLELNVLGNGASGKIPVLDFDIKRRLIHSLTLQRQGNHIYLFTDDLKEPEMSIDLNEYPDELANLNSFTLGTNKMEIKHLGTATPEQRTQIYGVRFFDRALTQDEIHDMYKEDRGRFPIYYKGVNSEDVS